MVGVDSLWLGVIHLDLSWLGSTALVIVGLVLPALVLLVLALHHCCWLSWGGIACHWVGFPWFGPLTIMVSLFFAASCPSTSPPCFPILPHHLSLSLTPHFPLLCTHIPLERGGAAEAATLLLRELRHYWGSPHPSIEGRGSQVGSLVMIYVGRVGMVVEDWGKMNKSQPWWGWWWIKTLPALTDNVWYEHMWAR